MPDKMRYETTQGAAKIAERLRKMADELETGTLTVVDQPVSIPEQLHLKIELEEEHEGEIGEANFEIEIELVWPVRMQDDG
ncbi:MAG: hypothetical protein OHK0046_43460 [Anaerolineae bacterium]